VTVESELSAAEVKSRAARAKLTATMVDIQSRLNPRTLIREAVEEIRDTGVELFRQGIAKARANPGPMIGIAATIAAYVARDWFVSHARRASAEQGQSDQETAEHPADTDEQAPDGIATQTRTIIKPDVKRPPRRKR
jgi:hypothetical protein